MRCKLRAVKMRRSGREARKDVKHWGAMYGYTGHHFPMNLKEAQQVTQQVCLLHIWDFLGSIEKKTTLEGKTTPWSYPQKR